MSAIPEPDADDLSRDLGVLYADCDLYADKAVIPAPIVMSVVRRLVAAEIALSSVRAEAEGLRAERDKLKDQLAEEEQSHEETIRHRDFCEQWADKLAYAVGDIEEIGEHSNLCNPWEEAYAIVRRAGEVRAIEAARDALRARVAVLEADAVRLVEAIKRYSIYAQTRGSAPFGATAEESAALLAPEARSP